MTRKVSTGIIPYYFKDDRVNFYFMIPSDPKYGGDKPQIAKGNLDEGLGLYENALKEGMEELGLVPSNIIHRHKVWERITKKTEFHVWAVEISDPDDWEEPHWETGATVWLNDLQIANYMRESQRHIIYHTIRELNKLRKACKEYQVA